MSFTKLHTLLARDIEVTPQDVAQVCTLSTVKLTHAGLTIFCAVQAERDILQTLHFAIPRDSIGVQLDLMALAVSQYVGSLARLYMQRRERANGRPSDAGQAQRMLPT